MTDSTTQVDELDARPLSEIVEAPRAIRALRDAGFTTLGHVRLQGLSAIQAIRWVGETSVASIATALAPILAEEEEEDAKASDLEEGVHDLHLASPHLGYKIKLLDSNRVERAGGGFAVQRPVYIEFTEGEAVLKKEVWLLLKFDRNPEKITTALADSKFAWRREALAYLQTVDGFNRDFHVRSD